MKKIFNLSSGELKKIFLRPTTYLVLVFIIASIYISSLLYNPTITSTKLVYSGQTDTSVYEKFIQDTNVLTSDGTNYTSKQLEEVKDEIMSFKNNEDKLAVLTNKIENCNSKYNALQNIILELSNSPANTSIAKDAFIDLKVNYVTPAYEYLLTSVNSHLNFFLEHKDYETLLDFFYRFGQSIPDNYDNYTSKEFITRFEYLQKNFNIKKSVYPITVNLEKIEIKSEKYDELLTKYYDEPKDKLNEIFSNIYTYYISPDDNLNEISELIANYNSTANISSTILKNQFLLEIASNHTDNFMQNKIDYKGFRRYLITEQLQKSKYLYENNLQDYNVLASFSFGDSQQKSSNAFDFAFYGMRISSIIIIIYLFFIIASIIAEDHSKGTIKLIAMREITRNKIVSAKYLSIILYGIFLSAFALISSFIIGLTMFGTTPQLVLASFNGSSAFLLSPIILLIFALVSNIINIMFFSSIVMLVAMLTKNSALTIFLGLLTYGASILGNGLLYDKIWYKIIPFAHIDLYKFFGNNTAGLLSFSLSPDTSFILSLFVTLLTIFLCNIATHIIFLKRDVA